MTDIVERVRALCPHDVSGYCKCTAQEAADRIAELEQQLARQRLQLEDYALSNIQDRQELAAAQAREKVMMVAIESLVENVDRPPDANCSCHISPPCSDCVDYGGLREAFEWVDTALAMPTDDTTLRAALKAERDRCAKKAEQLGKDLAELNKEDAMKFAGMSIACAIRALEDE